MPDFEKLVGEIGARLRPVCDDLPDDEFHALVVKVAETKRKFILRENAEAVLSSVWQGPVTSENLARRLGSIPHPRHFSSAPRKPPTSSDGSPAEAS